MRIAPFIILLLAAFSSLAQETISESNRSIGLEAYRSYMLPSSSAQEAAELKPEVMRYAIPLDGWTEQRAEQGREYATHFTPPFSWNGRQTIISLDPTYAPYKLLVGGREVGRNYNSSMPAEFNVTRFIKEDTQNPIVLSVIEGSEVKDLESWDGDNKETLGKVTMLSLPTMYIRDVEVSTTLVSESLNVTISIVVKSEALNSRTSRINYELLTPQGAVDKRGYADMTLEMRGEDTLHLFTIIPDSLAWSVDEPNLYRLNLSTQYRGRHSEYYSLDIGLRSIESGSDGTLSINGKPQQLKASVVNSSIELSQLDDLKKQGYNIVKIDAGAHNDAIYRYADSIGLMVVATAPINTKKSGGDILLGGNPTNDPSRGVEYIERVDAMRNQTKIHPSVVAYAIADHSLNGINLYESYLYLKARESQRPIIYLDGAGQWNSDKLKLDL